MVNPTAAVVGGGYWGKNIIRELKKLNVLKIICDTNTEVLSTHTDVETSTNWQDLLQREDIHQVFVVVPPVLHYKLVKAFLEADKDVFVEKPITLDIKEAEELVTIANHHQRILMVGHLLHYHPCVEKIKEIVTTDTIGEIVSITANRLNLGLIRKEENVLWSFAPHDISVILSLVDHKLPDKVRAEGKDILTKGVHDITNSVLHYKNGPYVSLNVSWLHPFKEQKMTIVGSKGMLVFDDTSTDRKLVLYKDHLTYKDDLPVGVKQTGQVVTIDSSISPLERELQHFLNCTYSRETPITDGQEAVRVLKVLHVLQQSLIEDEQEHDFNVHATATVDQGAQIGAGTKIWHYSHICKDAKIGKNCTIGQNVFIAGGAQIGDNCKVQNNVSIYAGVKAGNYVFFGPSCVLTNDINPRGMYSKNGEYMTTILEDGVTLGANSTVVCGHTLGKHALVGAGAVVTKDVHANEIVVGNPAHAIGTIDEKGARSLK